MEPSLPIGDQIKARRKAANLTQIELAQMTGLKQSAISDIENGKRRPFWDVVDKILSALPGEK